MDLFPQDLEKSENAIRGGSVCPVKKSHWKTIRGIITLGRGENIQSELVSSMSLFSKKVSKPPCCVHPPIHVEVTICVSFSFQNVSG